MTRYLAKLVLGAALTLAAAPAIAAPATSTQDETGDVLQQLQARVAKLRTKIDAARVRAPLVREARQLAFEIATAYQLEAAVADQLRRDGDAVYLATDASFRAVFLGVAYDAARELIDATDARLALPPIVRLVQPTDLVERTVRERKQLYALERQAERLAWLDD